MTLEKNKILSHNLTQRILTALVALALLFFVVYQFGSAGFLLLVVAASSLIANELANLFFDLKKEPLFNHLILRLVSISLIMGLLIAAPTLPASQMLINYFELTYLPLFLGMALIPLVYRKKEIQITFDRLMVFLFVGVYACFLPIKIFEIFVLDNSYYFFFFFAFLVFGVDSLAYVFGKLFGRKFFTAPFEPYISPSKTVEGFLGSLLWPVILIFATHQLQIFSFSAMSIILLILTALAAVSGDLIASLIKRKAQKKDSGHLFPGHGGVFDRLDSLLLSAPFFLIATKYFTLL